jgi:HSP20 family protein
MANLVRWDPFNEMTSLRDMMDRVFEQAWVRPTSVFEGSMSRFPVDLYEAGDEYVLTASLPGVTPEQVDVTVQGNTVTVSYERKRDENEGVTWHARELPYGRFTRQIGLPVHIDNEHVEASMEHGVLRLRLPKVAQARERRVEIKSGAGFGSTPQIVEGDRASAQTTSGHLSTNEQSTNGHTEAPTHGDNVNETSAA